MDYCGSCYSLIHKNLNNIFHGVHGGNVDHDLGILLVVASVHQVDISPPEGGEGDVGKDDQNHHLHDIAENIGLFVIGNTGKLLAVHKNIVDHWVQSKVGNKKPCQESCCRYGVKKQEQNIIEHGDGGDDGGDGDGDTGSLVVIS